MHDPVTDIKNIVNGVGCELFKCSVCARRGHCSSWEDISLLTEDATRVMMTFPGFKARGLRLAASACRDHILSVSVLSGD